jgi:hypothetical protein
MLIQLTRTTDAPAKPPEGEPCNGCGYCCDQQPCQIAEEVFGEDVAAPCPALGTGRGCDSTDPVRPLRSPE